ncbi:MAG: hypothetical protein QNJ94_18735 [Alphaproteobacteria bacterium]|nr:hypothetical protein [Alphaproteobacteria bacterium]
MADVFTGVIEKSRSGCGRNEDKDYVHVLANTFRIATGQTLAQWLTANPTHVYGDPNGDYWLIEITEAQFNGFTEASDFFHGGKENQPRWQQKTAGQNETEDLGSFAEPTNSGSTFTSDTEVKDDRFQLKIYDDDPTGDPAGTHLIEDDLDEGAAGSSTTRYVELLDEDGVRINRNKANDQVEIGGRPIVFNFGSAHTPSLTAGITTVKIATDVSGQIFWESNARYRHVGPSGEDTYIANIFSNTLRVVE